MKPNPIIQAAILVASACTLASLANAALLLLACGAILAEAIGRLLHPAPVAGFDVFVVATIGAV